jgi:hypothetical protein
LNSWRALAPISVKLETNNVVCSDFEVCRFDENQLSALLGKDTEYWSKIYFDEVYKLGYWFKFEFKAENAKSAWEKAIEHAKLFFEALALYKTTFSILAPAGLFVKNTGEVSSGISAHFGWENTIVSKPHYLLLDAEYKSLVDFFAKYKKFWSENRFTSQSKDYLKRIWWAKYYFRKAYETENLNERYIFLSIALEALCAETEAELRYRYANRCAVLLGDSITTRKKVYKFVLKAYDTRSKIVHGSIKWKIELDEVLSYSEIVRQMVLRSIALYSENYQGIGEILDECLHDSTKHKEILEKSKSFFGAISDYREPERRII